MVKERFKRFLHGNNLDNVGVLYINASNFGNVGYFELLFPLPHTHTRTQW